MSEADTIIAIFRVAELRKGRSRRKRAIQVAVGALVLLCLIAARLSANGFIN